MKLASKEAVWEARIPWKVFNIYFNSIFLMLIALVFFLPDQWHGFGAQLVKSVSSNFPFVTRMSLLSDFPFVTELAYSVAIISAFVLGIARCFTHLNMQALEKMVSSRSLLVRIFLVLVSLAVIFFVIYADISDSSGTYRQEIMFRATERRLNLTLVINGIFVIVYSAIFLMLYELTNLVRSFTKFFYRN